MTVSQNVLVITNLEELHAVKKSWLSLEKKANVKSIFNSYNWVETWARHYANYIKKLFVLTYWKKGELTSVLPLYVNISNEHAAYFVSSFEPTHIETCSEAQDFLSTSVEEVIPHSIFIDCLREHDVYSVTFNNISPRSFLCQWSRKLSGYHTIKQNRERFYISLPEGIKKLEKKTRRYRNAASRAGVTIHRVTNIDEFEEVFNALILLNSKRWLDKAKPAIFDESEFCNFHRELARKSLADNRLSLYYTKYENKIFAVNYSFVSSNSIVFYQSGIDTSFRPNVSPGNLLHYAQAFDALHKGMEVYDFMSSAHKEGYKTQLTSTSESVFSFTLHTSLLSYAMTELTERLKMIKKWVVNRGR